jgi:hypothetical protein
MNIMEKMKRYLNRGRQADAIGLLQEVVTRQPDHAEAQGLLRNLLTREA